MTAPALLQLPHDFQQRDSLGLASALKVLHVIPGIAPRYGGPSTVILPMVTALNRLEGVQAEVATTDADGPHGRLTKRDLPTDIPVHIFRRSFSEQWKVSLGLRRWLRQHVHEYDLVHIHAVWSFATAVAARAAERSGVPYIVRPAGMLSDYTWQRHGWKKWPYWNLIEARTIRSATAFHATSNGEADEIRTLRPDARVFVIPNGVDSAAFTQAADADWLRRESGITAGGLPIVLFLSRLHPKKGVVDLLLPALAAMREKCFLVIAGGADPHSPEHAREIPKVIERLILGQRVAILGAISPDDRWKLFDGADAFALPSHAENFGIVVTEAMARGCPVVVTDAVQASEHVIAARAGEVVGRDVAALAGALDRMVSQSELLRRYGESGQEYAGQNLRWEQIVPRIRDMYNDCVAKKVTATR